MTAVDDAASAILAAMPVPSSFPALGQVVSINVRRAGFNPAGAVLGVDALTVRILGTNYPNVLACGSFLAEINAAGTDRFEGREVVVIAVGGRLMVLTTSGGR